MYAQDNNPLPVWIICHKLTYLYLHQLSSISGGNCITLVLNPRTGHVLPQFHVKFDDLFETVQDKIADLDAPEPEWKYLSGFTVKKGHPDPAGRGITNSLIAPRRGPITMCNSSPMPEMENAPANVQEEPTIPDVNGTTNNQQGDLSPAHQPTTLLHGPQPALSVPTACWTPETEDAPADLQEEPTIPDTNGTTKNQQGDLSPAYQPTTHLHGPQPAPSVPTASQTRSSRIVRNTPRYEQSMYQWNQGLVAWEVLLNQEDTEDIPMAKSQYTIQRQWKTPLSLRQRITQTFCTRTKQ